jgi:hypothetical protein
MKREPATKKAKVEVRTAVKTTPDTVQLRLLPGGTTEPDWMLDERTRKVGRQGVAHAREILRRVAPPQAVRRAS